MCREGAVTDQTCQKQFAKFLGAIDIVTKKFSAVGLSYASGNTEQQPWPRNTSLPMVGASQRCTQSIHINRNWCK